MLVVLQAAVCVHDKQILECVQLIYGVFSLLALRKLSVDEKSWLKIMQIEYYYVRPTELLTSL